jgi:hypothetical protein
VIFLKIAPSYKTKYKDGFIHLWSIRHKLKWQHTSFVIISDCLKHDTLTVHLFQSKLWRFLCGQLKDKSKVYYFSDGAAL